MAAKRETVLQAILTADIAEFKKAMTRAGEQAQKVGKQMQDVGKKMSTYLTLPLAAAGGVAVANAVKFEKLATSLNVLTGSAEAGAKAFERIKQFSAATPFQLDELVSVNNQLMGFGLNADQAFNSLKMLGDVASVSGADLGRVALAFGQSAAAGRVMTQDLNQFINNGIPIYQLLQDVTGKNVGELRDLASQGLITFDLLEAAFKKGTSEGGKFFEGTAKLSQTLGGRLSTLRDNFNLMMGDIGQLIGEYLNPLISVATNVFKGFSQLSDSTKRWIVIIGGVVAAIGPLVAILGSVQMLLPLLIGGFTTLGTIFSALFSPVTLIVAGVAALAAAFIYLRDNSNVVVKHLKNGWTILKNFFVDTIKFILKPLDTFAQGLVNLAQLAGVTMQNPMSKLMGSLDGLKSKVVPVTDEFGSFKDALRNTAVDLGLIKKNADSATTAIENLNKATSKATGTAQVQTQTLDSLSTKTIEAGQATGRAAVMIDHNAWQEHQKNLKAAELSTAALETVTNGTAQSIVSSLGMLAGQSKGFALFEIATNTAIGLAKAIQAGAGLPFPANIPAIAAGSAAVLSGMASAKQVLSSAPAFADGGIVSGSSRYGDRVLARVNSGEMILNSGQQANLFDMINSGGSSGQLTAKIKGSDIWLSNSRAGKERRRYTGR